MFIDRVDAGRRLAERLAMLNDQDVVLLGLPRGGVTVAFEVARALEAPLDVIIVRKLGVPGQPELAMGALGEGGVVVINDEIVRQGRIRADELAEAQRRESVELADRVERLRGGRPPEPLNGRTALIVDDGMATGSTARAACQVARALGAQRVVLAVPVADPTVAASLHGDADAVVCLEQPEMLGAVGAWYQDFSQVSDATVAQLLKRATARPTRNAPPSYDQPSYDQSRRDQPSADQPSDDREPHEPEAYDQPPYDRDVAIDGGRAQLAGHLTVPEGAREIVLFVHGSGSSRHSPRNLQVARALNEIGLGTLLFDLLTPAEESDRANVFDIRLLAERLTEATRWLRGRPETQNARLGYFGASTGAAAALWAAAEPDADLAAVVSRGGRPDLAGPRLPDVGAPTLLLVGGHDEQVLELNRQAQSRMRCETHLSVVPGATHLFEEPGALEEVARQAGDWFTKH